MSLRQELPNIVVKPFLHHSLPVRSLIAKSSPIGASLFEVQSRVGNIVHERLVPFRIFQFFSRSSGEVDHCVAQFGAVFIRTLLE